MKKIKILEQDLKLRLPERSIGKAIKAILTLKDLTFIPLSPIYPRGFHPIVRIKKRLGEVDKEVLVSLMDFSILNKNNIPPWNRIFDFHLDTNYIEETSIQGIETILIGDREAIRRALYLLDNLIPTILRKPRKIYTFFNEIYLKYGENQFIGLKIMGSMLTFRSHGIPLSQLPKILGRGIFVLNSLFYSKNAEFYRLLFVTSLETFGYFYEFFMKHIYPKLPLEHREFLEEMHDYKNFLQLLYFHLSRMSVDKIRDEVGILIRRRSRPDRPIELGIIFRDRGIEVRDRISTAHIDLLV